MKINTSSHHFLIKKSDFKELFNIMKICLFLLLAFTFQMMATNTNAQDAIIELKSNSVTVGQLISEIEKQTDYLVVYSNREVNTSRTVNLKNKSDNVSEYLNQTFSGTDIGYDFENNYIVLSKKAQQTTTILTNLGQSVQQQGKTVRGTVTDSNGEPVIGATIVVKDNPTQGTVTDVDGNFILSNLPENAVLQITYVGMRAQEISTAGRSTIDITMEADTELLEEVVVVGYGTMKKSNLTYSISSINDDAIKDRAITTVGEALQGQLAGVRAQAQDGLPGEELTIRIRGMNTLTGDSSPLYVIDGVPRNDMRDLNPNDISSIQILKDAAATAIYGARGGNGVVLIETKQGDGKPSISFNGYYGTQQAEKKLDMMSGEEYLVWNIYRRNLNHLRSGGSMKDPMSERAAGNQIPDYWLTTTDYVDWQDEVLQNAPIQNYDLSATTKGEFGNVYMSIGYMNQEGIVKHTYYERLNARINSTLNIGEKMRVGINLAGNTSSQDAGDSNKGKDGSGKESPLHHAIMLTPFMQLNQGTRDWGFPENVGRTYPNPVEQLKATTDNEKYSNFSANIMGEYDILTSLTFKTQYNYDYIGSVYEFFQPGNVGYANGYQTRGSSNSSSSRNWLFQNTLTFDQYFKDHHLNFILGQSAESRKYFRINAGASGWPYETIETLNVASTPTQAQTTRSTYKGVSFFGRAMYEYADKYLLTSSLRYDGSSRFGPNSKWGLFPSLSAGWKISGESFMEDIDWLSLMKIRASWGKSGNDRIGDYAYMARLGTYNTSWGDGKVSGVAPSNIANLGLKWEATSSLDLGFDLTAFNNRFQLNFDYYINTTDDLLFNVTIPYTTGFSSITDNIGSIRNTGWEVDLMTYNIQGKFNWSTNLNLSRNRNEVLSMGEVTQFITTSWDGQTITKVGAPISQFYAYKTDGILTKDDFDAQGKALVPILSGQEEGNTKYVDVNGDGKINADDYVEHGNNLPDLMYGLTNRFSWNNFDLSILVQGQLGGKVLFLGARQYDNGQADTRTFSRWNRSYKPDYEALYGPGENPIPTELYDKFGIDYTWDGTTINPVGTNNNNDDRRIYDATYLRIKNITLGYEIPRKILNSTILNSVRLYLSADNLTTFDKYPGFTPETNSFGNNTTLMGIDYSTYPLSRRLIFGVNIIF